MEYEHKNIIPNSTQIPNVILDYLLPELPEAEARCLLYICRRTFGFQKEKDSIGLDQFVNGMKTKSGERKDKGVGLPRTNVIRALKVLDAAGAIKINKGPRNSGIVNTYEINLAMDIGKVAGLVQNKRKEIRSKWSSATNDTSATSDTSSSATKSTSTSATSDTHKTKGNKEKQSISAEAGRGEEKEEIKPIEKKPKSEHAQFIEYWFDLVKRTRHIHPAISPADASMLKRVLDAKAIPLQRLEQLALYFLASPKYKMMAPSVATFLSTNVLLGLQNAEANDTMFWRDLNAYSYTYFQQTKQITRVEPRVEGQPMMTMATCIASLRSRIAQFQS